MGSKKDNKMTGFLVIMGIVAFLAVLAVLAVLGLYFYHFHVNWGDQEKFAQFGDFLGGVLNPIFSLLTVALLIGSLYFQRRELGQVVVEMELTREVHTSSLNMNHYMYLLEESVKETSDLHLAAKTFTDTLIEVSITIPSPQANSYQELKFSLFEVLSNPALFEEVDRDGYIVHLRDFKKSERTETRTLLDHGELLEAATKTMFETVHLLKQLGCPRWRAKDVLEVVEDVITDYFQSSSCDDTYRDNLLSVNPSFEALVQLCNGYKDDLDN